MSSIHTSGPLARLWLPVIVLALLSCSIVRGQVPEYAGSDPLASTKGKETAVLAGGCFWGVDAVFRHVKGVKMVVSGYSGGSSKTVSYQSVSRGNTGHAESVKITFDPAKVSYAQLLRIFFSVAMDPTQLNRQGPDEGPQYRSVIFYAGDTQKQVALAYIDQLDKARVFSGPIVTQVVPFDHFVDAEPDHQNYFASHLDDSYIIENDMPKLRALQKEFPELYSR